MIPSNQRIVKTIATLAVVAGIIVLAIFSALDKSGQAEDKSGRTIEANVSKQKLAAGTAVGTPAPVEASAEVLVENAAVPPAKKPERDFVYSVKKGDTLYALALAYDVSVDDIKNANDLTGDNLKLDQKLLIPVSGPVAPKEKAPEKAPAKSRKIVHVASRSKSTSRITGPVVGEMVEWESAKSLFTIGDTATVIDVETGLSFRIKRKGGHNHADNEPLTAEDAAIMKKIYGGSWSWDRRAIVLVAGGKKIAASMAGMPHGSENITNNEFSGHFDIHFKGSMTHGSEYTKSRRPVVDSQHQAMVRKAAGL